MTQYGEAERKKPLIGIPRYGQKPGQLLNALVVTGLLMFSAAVAASEGRHEVEDAGQRQTVEDADPRHEVSDAEPRHEVEDAEQRHEVEDAEPRDSR